MATTLFRSHYRVDLTAKQRQVLELVARGRTNFEIAQELGISLDGAKWHLRELFAKLDVDSREEAAEWWRSYNTPGARISRMARALLPATLGKWLLAGGVSAVVVVGIAVAVIVAVGNGGNGDQQAAGNATVTPTADTTPTPNASATPSTATPGPSPTPEVIAGLPVQTMSWGDPVPLPQGVVVWYYNARFGTEGGPAEIGRAWRDGRGNLHNEQIADLNQYGFVGSMAVNATVTEMVAAVCRPKDMCGTGLSFTPGETADDQVLFRSVDGGVTWSNLGSLPGHTFVRAVVDGQVLIQDVGDTPASGPMVSKFWFYGSNEPVQPPADVAHPFPIVVPGFGLAWIPDTWGAVHDSSGNLMFAPVTEAPNAQFIGALQDGISFFTWTDGKAGGYIAAIGPDGKPQAVHGGLGMPSPYRWGAPISASQILGTVGTGGPDAPTVYGLVLFDLDGRVIHPVTSLFNPASNGPAPFLWYALTGGFAEVHTGGDCLNVRQEASTSSKSLGCFADGVLLQRSDVVSVDEDGTTWYSVTTPSGAAGWASAEFLIQ